MRPLCMRWAPLSVFLSMGWSVCTHCVYMFLHICVYIHVCVCVCVSVCVSTESLRQPIAAAGAVELMAAALRRHADHADVAVAACRALYFLSTSGA